MPLYRGTRGLVLRRRPVAGVVFSLTNVDSAVDIVGGTTVDYSSKSFSFGAANANRNIVVVFWGRSTDTTTPAVTIGGVTASLVAGTKGVNTNTTYSMIFQAAVPTGATGAVSIVAPASILRSGVGIYRLITTTPAVSSANATQAIGPSSLNASVTVPTGGGGIGVFSSRDTITTNTWTNAVADFNNPVSTGGNVTGATVSGTGSVSVTCSVGSVEEMCLSLAAWGP